MIEASKFATIKVESHSQTLNDPSLVKFNMQCRLCAHSNDDLYYSHHFHYAATENIHGQVFIQTKQHIEGTAPSPSTCVTGSSLCNIFLLL